MTFNQSRYLCLRLVLHLFLSLFISFSHYVYLSLSNIFALDWHFSNKNRQKRTHVELEFSALLKYTILISS